MSALAPIDRFAGDFDLLPIASDLRYGPVAAYRTGEDFQNAVGRVFGDLDTYAEAHWYVEATRWRLHNSRPLNDGLREIAAKVAARLHERAAAESCR